MIQRNILWASHSELPAGWPIIGHKHPYYHLFFLIMGKASFLLDDKVIEVSAGDCLIVPPNVYHEVPAEGHTLLDTYEVKFVLDDDKLQQMVAACAPLIRGASEYVRKSAQYIVYNWAKQDPLSFDHMDHILRALLLSVYLDQSMGSRLISTYIETDAYSELTKGIIAYVEQNYTERLSLERMAAALEYNKQYLCSVFKENTGLTIVEYANHIRIRQATFQLYYHDIPIGVLGCHVGFSSTVHFDRVFKKLVGLLPSQFKALYSISNKSLQERTALPALYEDLLGVKILPLHTSIANLRKLGDAAHGETSNLPTG